MIFLGDIACPDEKIDDFLSWTSNEKIFFDEVVIANLEANIVDRASERRNLTLYNNSKISKMFPNSRKLIVSLANNHMYDYPQKILSTKRYLEENGIGCFGIYDGNTIKPYEYVDQDEMKYAFFGHCWRLYTHTNLNTENSVRVVDCEYDEFIKTVKDYIVDNPNVRVYCFMHWNYDLEWLPFPMQRTISRKLIDAGVSGIIGGHSHRPQGMEEYKGKPIVYCMGNFYLPSGYYFDGKLNYPPCSKSTYVVRIKDAMVDIPWFYTDTNPGPLELQMIEPFINGENCKRLSPFSTMNQQDYIVYFAKNRVKKKLVPLFTEPFGNKYLLDEKWAIIRVKIIRFLKGVLKR